MKDVDSAISQELLEEVRHLILVKFLILRSSLAHIPGDNLDAATHCLVAGLIARYSLALQETHEMTIISVDISGDGEVSGVFEYQGETLKSSVTMSALADTAKSA